MRKDDWHTYNVSGYTHQVGDDQRATGAVHLHQVRRTRAGYYYKRVVDSNGRFFSPGTVTPISEEQGEALLQSVLEGA